MNLKEIFYQKIGMTRELSESLSGAALEAFCDEAKAFSKEAGLKIGKRINNTKIGSKNAVVFASPENTGNTYESAVKAMTAKHGKGKVKDHGTETSWTVDGLTVALYIATGAEQGMGYTVSFAK